MDYYEANEVIIDYGNELIKNELFHSLSIFKHTKKQLILAFKIHFIHMAKCKTHTKEQFDRELSALLHIGIFINHDDYLVLKNYEYGDIQRDSELRKLFNMHFANSLSWDSYHEVADFMSILATLDSEDSLFYQRAYTMAGIEYKPEYKAIMESVDRDTIKEYLDYADKVYQKDDSPSAENFDEPTFTEMIKSEKSNTRNNHEIIKATVMVILIFILYTLYK